MPVAIKISGARQSAYSYATISAPQNVRTKRYRSERPVTKCHGAVERVGDGAIGSTAAFEAVNLGSSPSPQAIIHNDFYVRLR